MAHPTTRRGLAAAAVLGTALSGVLFTGSEASAAPDRDGDGMPNRWERTHGLDPDRRDGARDLDRDGLVNLREWRQRTLPAVEDTDRDGSDDGDEVDDGTPSTDVSNPDTDDDGTEDGDEDHDHDEVDDEDEDDGDESCGSDDDDADGDDVADEDENEQGSGWRDSDSDDDGVEDGDEDSDDDSESNEDEDDADDDSCDGDLDDDGEDDEDCDDSIGTVTAFDPTTYQLGVRLTDGGETVFLLDEDTEVEWEDAPEPDDEADDDEGDDDEGDDDRRGGDDEGSLDDLQPGVGVAEVDVDDDSGVVEEIEIYLVP